MPPNFLTGWVRDCGLLLRADRQPRDARLGCVLPALLHASRTGLAGLGSLVRAAARRVRHELDQRLLGAARLAAVLRRRRPQRARLRARRAEPDRGDRLGHRRGLAPVDRRRAQDRRLRRARARLFTYNLRGAVFYDTGNAFSDWNTPLEYSVGIGLRWRLPMMLIGVRRRPGAVRIRTRARACTSTSRRCSDALALDRPDRRAGPAGRRVPVVAVYRLLQQRGRTRSSCSRSSSACRTSASRRPARPVRWPARSRVERLVIEHEAVHIEVYDLRLRAACGGILNGIVQIDQFEAAARRRRAQAPRAAAAERAGLPAATSSRSTAPDVRLGDYRPDAGQRRSASRSPRCALRST